LCVKIHKMNLNVFKKKITPLEKISLESKNFLKLDKVFKNKTDEPKNVQKEVPNFMTIAK